MKSRRVVIIGPPGSGKTSAGVLLANKLQLRFIDTDEIIVTEQNMPVGQIFSEFGEPHFRRLESELIDRFLVRCKENDQEAFVMATGGGIAVAPGNFEKLAQIGTVVCLIAPAGCLAKRLSTDTTRPLLAAGRSSDDDKTAKLESLLLNRKDVYGRCEHKIETANLTPQQVAQEIEKLLK